MRKFIVTEDQLRKIAHTTGVTSHTLKFTPGVEDILPDETLDFLVEIGRLTEVKHD